jgi:hypothetical protein
MMPCIMHLCIDGSYAALDGSKRCMLQKPFYCSWRLLQETITCSSFHEARNQIRNTQHLATDQLHIRSGNEHRIQCRTATGSQIQQRICSEYESLLCIRHPALCTEDDASHCQCKQALRHPAGSLTWRSCKGTARLTDQVTEDGLTALFHRVRVGLHRLLSDLPSTRYQSFMYSRCSARSAGQLCVLGMLQSLAAFLRASPRSLSLYRGVNSAMHRSGCM